MRCRAAPSCWARSRWPPAARHRRPTSTRSCRARSPPAPPARAAAPSGATAIILEPIRVPAQVDQPQWVVRLADDTVAVLEQERWASSLRDELREALLEELIVGHGMVDARTVPAPQSPPWRIAIDVRRFDSLPGARSAHRGIVDDHRRRRRARRVALRMAVARARGARDDGSRRRASARARPPRRCDRPGSPARAARRDAGVSGARRAALKKRAGASAPATVRV